MHIFIRKHKSKYRRKKIFASLIGKHGICELAEILTGLLLSGAAPRRRGKSIRFHIASRSSLLCTFRALISCLLEALRHRDFYSFSVRSRLPWTHFLPLFSSPSCLGAQANFAPARLPLTKRQPFSSSPRSRAIYSTLHS